MTASAAASATAPLLFPAIRWDPNTGFQRAWPDIERAVELGVGGFIIFGGEAGAVRELTTEAQRIAAAPLLIASDLERGAGQQFPGAIPLPPAAAIASLEDRDATHRAAEITAREARGLGIGWVLAPVADLDLEPRNPIVGTRAFGGDATRAAAQVEAWVAGCAAGGALSCAKHFPGHGRSIADSHVERPRVYASREELEEDLHPFRAAIAAGTDAVMAAHVAFAALDVAEEPATRSAPILRGLLREKLGFQGIVATDAINMAGFAAGEGEGEGAISSVVAGCDALLYPRDFAGTAAAMGRALKAGRLTDSRLASARQRIAGAAERVAEAGTGGWGRAQDRTWALQLACRTLYAPAAAPGLPDGTVQLIEIDDDVGGPHPAPSRAFLRQRLRTAGVELSDQGSPLLAIYADIRAWKRRSGLSEESARRARQLLTADPTIPVLLFGPPRLVLEFPDARTLLVAWGGEPLMQEAVAVRLTDSR